MIGRLTQMMTTLMQAQVDPAAVDTAELTLCIVEMEKLEREMTDVCIGGEMVPSLRSTIDDLKSKLLARAS